MTLSTRAEHAAAAEADRAYDDADSNPYAVAERHVLPLGEDATEADPATVDVREVAREAAEAAREEMADAAVCYGSRHAAERAGEEAFRVAYERVEEMVDESPLLEADQ